MIEKILFILLGISNLGVAFAKSTFHSALALLSSFIIGGLIIGKMSFSLIGLIMIIVYAGAIATLFLFASMMIGKNEEKAEEKISFKSLRTILITLVTIFIYSAYFYNVSSSNLREQVLFDKNYKSVAINLYENFNFTFQAVGFILLLAVIGANIVKSRVHKASSKQMDPSKQIAHKTTIRLIPNKKALGAKND